MKEVSETELLSFIRLVVAAIQTDFRQQRECRKALTEVLEDADHLHLKLTGKRIVKRGNRSVLDELTGSQPLSKLKNSGT